MNYRIPFNKPQFVGNELEYISGAMNFGKVSGDGEYTRRCSVYLQTLIGSVKALLTTSCTHALEMSALLLDIREGDEIIVPSFTFVSTVNAFVLRGARPVFADIRPDTLNMDEQLLEGLITSKTKAIVPVHYAGVGCEMDVITTLAKQHNLSVVEDNAHGIFGSFKGQKLGSFGCMSTQSFHETKNIHCGEGGALMLNDQSLVERAEVIREKGTNRSRYFRGQVDKYSWVDLGSSYLPSDMLAAFLCAQLERSAEIQAARKKIWNRYLAELKYWAADNNATLPFVPEHCEQPYHLFYMLMPSLEHRHGLIEHLKSQGILAVYHYVPLHSSEMGQSMGTPQDACPVTSDVSNRIVRLPLYLGLTEQEQADVISAVKTYSTSNAFVGSPVISFAK